MNDRVRLCAGLLANFCTNPDWGVLDVINLKVTLNKAKAFNTARRLLNAGANTIRILRHAPWANPVRFDNDCDGFWPTLREYVQILHQPSQQVIPPYGAEVWLELFDGCGRVGAPNQTTLDKEWMYLDYSLARLVTTGAFKYLGDLPYVKFGCGNEMNQPKAIDFHKKVLYPEFKMAGKVPMAFGPMYSDEEDILGVVKKDAGDYWLERDKLIFRQIHNIRDSLSPHFKWFTENWMNHPICVSLSGDGVKPRPTPAEFASVLEYVFKHTTQVEFQNPADTKVKFCFERMAGEDAEAAISAASVAYHKKFGAYPSNYGKYLYDYQYPLPPTPIPPTPPEPNPEPPKPQKRPFWTRAWHWMFGKNSLWHKIFK